MATINNGSRFIYANQTSDEFNVLGFVTFGSSDETSNDEESNIITSTTPDIDTWHLHEIEKSAPLQFPLTICSADGKFIDSENERALKKWLCKKQRYWLQVEQNDLSNIYYNCIIVNPQKVDAGKMSAGIRFQVICDSNHAWSGLITKKYTTTNGALTFNFNNISDYDEFILSPTLIITSNIDQNISIKNNTTNKTITINNCKANEVITLDGSNELSESSIGRILVNDWNVEFLEMRSGLNNITLTGNFTMQIQYRLPIRVGG